ncbi:MAG: hypothetical protein ACK5SX_06685 [Sandaracinobacter sp.]
MSAILMACGSAAVGGQALQDNGRSDAETRLSLTNRQVEIIQTVRSVDGYVDENLHKEFWALMPAALSGSPQARYLLERLLSDVREERSDFQKQSWLSAKESLTARRVVRTKGYLDACAAVLAASDNPGYQSKIQESIRSAERLIAAAASGSPLDVPGGRTFITFDVIDQILGGIEASEFRFAKLVDPTWDGKLTLFQYPEAHIATLALTPFKVSRQRIANSGARNVEMLTLSRTIGGNTYVAIGFTRMENRYSDPIRSLISNATAAIDGSGATGRPPISMKWQGYNSALASGLADTSEGKIFISVRVVELPAKGLFQFLAVSQVSAAEALNQRASLEESVQFLL